MGFPKPMVRDEDLPELADHPMGAALHPNDRRRHARRGLDPCRQVLTPVERDDGAVLAHGVTVDFDRFEVFHARWPAPDSRLRGRERRDPRGRPDMEAIGREHSSDLRQGRVDVDDGLNGPPGPGRPGSS